MNLNRGLPGEPPIDDISGLKIKHIKTVGQLSVVELENVTTAITKYLSRQPTATMAPFTSKWMKKVHGEMLGKVWRWAGTCRNSDSNIGIDWCLIDCELVKLSQDVAYWAGHGGDVMEQAAIIHHRSVQIHPFPNGNGRWSRLLGQIWQYRQAEFYTEWPEQELWEGVTPIRDEYIQALKTADSGDIGPLGRLQERYTSRPNSLAK